MNERTWNWDYINDMDSAFKAIESECPDILVKRGYMCCHSCSASGLSGEFKKPKNKKFIGAVYTTKQQESSLRFGGKIFLCYPGRTDELTQQIGDRIVAILKKNTDLSVEWDGKFQSCIEIKPRWS